MKISTKGRYAFRMMAELAENAKEGFLSLNVISKRLGVSKKYLEQIVPLMHKAQFLKTNRGLQGGYQLAKAPAEYTVGEILRAAEGSIMPVVCLDEEPNQCDRCGKCMTLPVWKGLADAIAQYLDGITLQDVLDNRPAANYAI